MNTKDDRGWKRDLVFRFYQLPFLDRLQICLALDLVTNKDENLFTTYKPWFNTIMERAEIEDAMAGLINLVNRRYLARFGSAIGTPPADVSGQESEKETRL
jgi:hypothetical protein